jgi:hypothetical protein
MQNRPQYEEEFIQHELTEWGDYVEERLRQALAALNVGYTQELISSLSHRVMAASASQKGQYQQLFKEYGRFVDMGAGRGQMLQTEANKRRALKRRKGARQPKKWYSKTFYGSLNKLIGNLSANYAAFVMQQMQVIGQNNTQNTI